MFEKESLDITLQKIREERRKNRSLPDNVSKNLTELKKKEPDSDKPFFRLAIIGYEIGKSLSSLEHSIVYYERFKQGIIDNDKEHKAYLKNAQLEIGDCFTQLELLCNTYNFDVLETRELGAQHLAERHEDFKAKGWTEIGGVDNGKSKN